jgi:hypothetical protein
MHYGAHTDYYTITYDRATLLTDFNKDAWGLCVNKNWNTYKTRQEGMEWFVTHARGEGAKFVTGKELIDSIKSLVKIGQDKANGGTIDLSSAGNWEFVSESGSTENTSSKSISNLEGSANIKAGEEYAVFAIDFDAGTLSNATHISLDYKQTAASTIRLVLENETIREVTLSHRYPEINISGKPDDTNTNYNSAQTRPSGMIPISAFDFPPNTEHTMNYSAVDVSKVVRIEIQPLAPELKQPAYGAKESAGDRQDDFTAKFKFANFTVHSGTPFNYDGPDVEPGDEVAIVKTSNVNGRTLSLAGISSNALRLNIAQAGKYDVKIYGVNGRLLQSFNAANLSAGVNTLKLNRLSSGVYLIKIQGINTKQQLTKSAMVL